MDDLSDRIAAYVSSKSLGREDVVSILIPRCEWMAIAAMGVMKAGCAYQPLDPTYPAERLNFMMKDAGVRFLIADAELLSIVDEYKGEVLLTKDIQQLPKATELPEGPKTDNLFTYNGEVVHLDKTIRLKWTDAENNAHYVEYGSPMTDYPADCAMLNTGKDV